MKLKNLLIQCSEISFGNWTDTDEVITLDSHVDIKISCKIGEMHLDQTFSIQPFEVDNMTVGEHTAFFELNYKTHCKIHILERIATWY